VFQQYWAANSPHVDVFMVDVIWQGICAPHAGRFFLSRSPSAFARVA
jgi:trehalose/maltose transport system substrate-binding protein